ncbi:mechanosensitive ion channel family protein, partial [candidate division WWE3 bacterium]|nr:mechanosensitive ion channel family protein [candidate division WWE3 bacterium]
MFGLSMTTELWDNSIQEYMFSIGLLLLISLSLKIVHATIVHRLKSFFLHTDTLFDDTIIKAIESIKGWYYPVAALFFALIPLTLPSYIDKSAFFIFILATTSQFISAVQIFINYAIKNKLALANEESAKSLIGLINNVVGVLLWALGFLFILSNIGVNVTSLVTGLGIGGLAIALAVQNILGDLLNSLAILLDKPFEVGDFITVGEDMGTVEEIGIKTTRLRALSGEELVMPNSLITETRIHNFGRMAERRSLFTIGVTYDCPSEKLASIPTIINDIITSHENVRLERTNLTTFGDFSINFESIYFVLSDDYQEYADTHQAILLEIRKAFEDND